MRIAVFTDNDFRRASGLTTTLGAVLQYAPSDLRPRIYSTAESPATGPGTYAIRSAGVRIGGLCRWPDLGALVADATADGVRLVHLADTGLMGLASRLMARRLALPMVGSWRGEFPSSRAWRRTRHVAAGYARWLYGRCEPILVPTAATYDAMVRSGYPSGRLRLWPGGVDAAQFHPGRRSRELRAQWSVSDHRPAILLAGRLAQGKGLAVAIDAAVLLRDHGVSHRLIVAGEGPLRDTIERKCSDAVFLGSVPRAEMPAVMASSDVLLFPGSGESLGNTVLEAQASGLPVLVADRGSAASLVHHVGTGFVCAAGDAFDFAWRLTMLLRDVERRRQFGAAARAAAERRSWEVALGSLFDAWRGAVARASDRRHAGLRYAPGWAGER